MELPKYPGSAFCPPGIEPHGNTVLQPAHFTVQTVDAGMGEVLVYIEDPEGHTEEVWRASGDERGWHGLGARDPQADNRDGREMATRARCMLGAGGWGITVRAARHCGVRRGCGHCDLLSSSFPIGQGGSQQRQEPHLRGLLRAEGRWAAQGISLQTFRIPVTCLALAERTPLSARIPPPQHTQRPTSPHPWLCSAHPSPLRTAFPEKLTLAP